MTDTPEAQAAAWDEALAAAPNPHLLQSYRWGQLQANFGWEVERRRLALGGSDLPVTMLLAPTLAPGGRFAYVPKGPAADAGGLGAALDALAAVAGEMDLAFVRVEPEVEADYRPPAPWVKAPATQPENTSIIDLTPDLDALLAGFKPKTRYNIRLAERKGVAVERSADVATFARLAAATSARHRIQLATEPYYARLFEIFAGDDSARLYLASHEGEALAGIVIMRFAGRATYLFGASTAKKRNLMPAYLLHWHAIQELHAADDVEYDLWGVPPENAPDHPLAGLWQFKSGWNGRRVDYAGAFDLPLDVTKWRVHKAMSRARSSLRRMKSRIGGGDG